MVDRDIDRVLDLYDREESALWGTLANELKIGRNAIKTYFDSFLDRSSLAIETLNVVYRQPSETIASLTEPTHLALEALQILTRLLK